MVDQRLRPASWSLSSRGKKRMHTVMDLYPIMKSNGQNPHYHPSADLRPMLRTRVKRPMFDGSMHCNVLRYVVNHRRPVAKFHVISQETGLLSTARRLSSRIKSRLSLTNGDSWECGVGKYRRRHYFIPHPSACRKFNVHPAN